MSWFWAWNFANTLSVNDVIFAKRLTDITPYTDYIEKLTAIFAPDELDDIDTLPEINYPAYSSTNFLSDVYMTRHDYTRSSFGRLMAMVLLPALQSPA